MPGIAERGWLSVEPPPAVGKTPTMLIPGEQALLYALAREHYSGAGAIVDAGCFLGGSTIALAAGVRDRAAPVRGRPIVTFDRFETELYFFDFYESWFAGRRVGESFRDLFDTNLAGFADLIEVRAGDVLEQRWDGEPIEILFLDVCKTPAINDHFVKDFLPHLIPGHSVIVQQDYFWGQLPWIHISLEQLRDYLEPLGGIGTSAAFLVTGPIPPDVPTMAELGDRRRRELMDQAVERAPQERRGLLELARTGLDSDDRDRMRAELGRIATRYAGVAEVEFCLGYVARSAGLEPLG